MNWYFYVDDNDIIQLKARFEDGDRIGDARSQVEPGGTFYDVSYETLRQADNGYVSVDEEGRTKVVAGS